MEEESKNIIKKFGEDLAKDFQKAIPSASGETAESINSQSTDTGFVIRGAAHIGALVDGRKPTSSGAKKGNPTLREKILERIKRGYIVPRDNSITDESLAFLISRSIHKNGTKGNKNLFDGIVTQSKIDSIASSILRTESVAITSNILKEFK